MGIEIKYDDVRNRIGFRTNKQTNKQRLEARDGNAILKFCKILSQIGNGSILGFDFINVQKD